MHLGHSCSHTRGTAQEGTVPVLLATGMATPFQTLLDWRAFSVRITPDQLPHWIGFNLYDPFKWSAKKTDEEKARGLLVELNNGRLAMIGIAGMVGQELNTNDMLWH